MGPDRKERGQALTGVRVGRVSSLENARNNLVPTHSGGAEGNITKIRDLLCVQNPEQPATPATEAETIPLTLREPCPCCGGPMRIIEIFRRGQKPMSRAPPREQAA